MHTPAELIPPALGAATPLPGAVAQVDAVGPAPGGAVVTGGYNLVIADNDGPAANPAAGGALQHRLGDVQIVVLFVNPAHDISPFWAVSSLCSF